MNNAELSTIVCSGTEEKKREIFKRINTSDKKQLILSSNTYKQIDVVAGQGQNWCHIVSKSKTGGPYGLLDRNGKEIAAPEMEALESAGTGYLR